MDQRVKEIYFTKVSDIRDHYTLLEDVFPNADGRISTTKRVCFAKNKRKENFVVKQRHKQNSFKDDNEVKDWLFARSCSTCSRETRRTTAVKAKDRTRTDTCILLTSEKLLILWRIVNTIIALWSMLEVGTCLNTLFKRSHTTRVIRTR